MVEVRLRHHGHLEHAPRSRPVRVRKYVAAGSWSPGRPLGLLVPSLKTVQRERDRAGAGREPSWTRSASPNAKPLAGGNGPLKRPVLRVECRHRGRRVERCAPAPQADLDRGHTLEVGGGCRRRHRLRPPGRLEARGTRLNRVHVERRDRIEIPQVVPHAVVHEANGTPVSRSGHCVRAGRQPRGNPTRCR